jgi:predicted DCC family thiol-disulfide oxidoreductase YuxK
MTEAAPDATPESTPEKPRGNLPEPASSAPLILFDGVCNLCHAAVSWVIERDRKKVFRFASLQSRAARAALAALPDEEKKAAEAAGRLDSMILIDRDGAHLRSDAAIRICRALGFPWSLAGIGAVLPRPLRNGLYDWIARNRYRWFGRQNACLVPTPELRSRFLDAGEPPLPATALEDISAPTLPETVLSPTTPARERPSLAATGASYLHRFVLVYLFLQDRKSVV